MSKFPITGETQKVEDVLSSIRKLVSEEARARGGVETDTENRGNFSQPPRAIGDMLILTPELRADDSKPVPLRLDTPVIPLHAPSPNLMDEDIDLEVAPFHDEVALRKLVGEMIREELQGELGARITRNVRKLIKREIAEALAESE